jgi:ankyrin repeat protein
LKKCRKKSDVVKALEELPQTLDETYQRILLSIDDKYQPEARRALVWLAFSERPLSIEELAEASIIDPQSEPPFDPDERLHDPCNDILEILGSLISFSSQGVVSDSGSDLDTYVYRDLDCDLSAEGEGNGDFPNTVRLAHFSVKEYLISKRIQGSPASEFGITDVESHYLIAESSLLYFFYYDEWESKAMSIADLEALPLLQYVCTHWHVHVKYIPQEVQSRIDHMIFKLFLSNRAILNWLQVHRPDLRDYKAFTAGGYEIEMPLHYTSITGLITVAKLLLVNGAEIEAKYHNGHTPLQFASEYNQKDIVRLLVEKGADIEAKDNKGWTTLYRAIFGGKEDMVRLLLEKRADIEAKDNEGWAELYRAIFWGKEDMVRLLLEKGADIEATDNEGWTALYRAVFWGKEDMVRLLLEKGADIEAKDNERWAALYRAAYQGKEDIVRFLLEKGADIEAKDNEGRTALY